MLRGFFCARREPLFFLKCERIGGENQKMRGVAGALLLSHIDGGDAAGLVEEP
jgi:hypothetical protein